MTHENGNGSIRRWRDDWLRWLVGGLIAGLVAYGGVSSRLTAVETQMTDYAARATEDRVMLRQAIDQLRDEIMKLRTELHDYELSQSLRDSDRQRHP